MIREERTRGLEWEEPSMEDPTFTANEVRWFALTSQAAWCRQKIAELVERANRAVEELAKARALLSRKRHAVTFGNGFATTLSPGRYFLLP